MENERGEVCLLPEGTSILILACVKDRRKGDFSSESAASNLRFSCAALKCSSSSNQKSG